MAELHATGSPLDWYGVFCELKLFLKVEIKGTKQGVLCRLKVKVVPPIQALCNGGGTPFFPLQIVSF